MYDSSPVQPPAYPRVLNLLDTVTFGWVCLGLSAFFVTLSDINVLVSIGTGVFTCVLLLIRIAKGLREYSKPFDPDED